MRRYKHRQYSSMEEVKLKKKSLILQLVLNIFFGPFGLFYSGKITAIILCILCVVLIPAYFLGVFLTWPLSIIFGVFYVNYHNDNI